MFWIELRWRCSFSWCRLPSMMDFQNHPEQIPVVYFKKKNLYTAEAVCWTSLLSSDFRRRQPHIITLHLRASQLWERTWTEVLCLVCVCFHHVNLILRLSLNNLHLQLTRCRSNGQSNINSKSFEPAIFLCLVVFYIHMECGGENNEIELTAQNKESKSFQVDFCEGCSRAKRLQDSLELFWRMDQILHNWDASWLQNSASLGTPPTANICCSDVRLCEVWPFQSITDNLSVLKADLLLVTDQSDQHLLPSWRRFSADMILKQYLALRKSFTPNRGFRFPPSFCVFLFTLSDINLHPAGAEWRPLVDVDIGLSWN